MTRPDPQATVEAMAILSNLIPEPPADRHPSECLDNLAAAICLARASVRLTRNVDLSLANSLRMLHVIGLVAALENKLREYGVSVGTHSSTDVFLSA